MKIQIETNPRPQDEQLIRDGLLGETFWQWLHISTLWLAEEQREQGLGGQLLHMRAKRGLLPIVIVV